MFKAPLDTPLRQSLAGLALVSGKFIESRLSTHSSAGNHLIVEAVGLFWIGKALQKEKIGKKWLRKAREILWKQTLIQLNPDGTSQEQSFWYLGFVLDALFHYILLEDRDVIPKPVWNRVANATEFMHEMILLDGSFPGFGGVRCKGAFHLGACKAIANKGNLIEAEFDDFIFSIAFPSDFTVEIFHGSEHPFMGWRSTIYGAWEPIYSIIFSFQLSEDYHCKTILNIVEN